MRTVIEVDCVSKAYQIGQFGTGTISRDLERFWVTKICKKEDPFLRIGEKNDRSAKGSSDIVWSLKEVSFAVQQGDAVGIIGKNGAGKSTLLKILSRVTTPTAGEVRVKGRISSLLEVGTGFHPELSGRENIFLNGAILGMRKSEINRKLEEIIDFSGVERYIDTPVKRYSSGMYVRLAFAVAAHLESEILVVDEVLAVGDAEFRNKCLGKMQDISTGQGRTVLFVSHDMTAIAALCNQGLVLQHGQITQVGHVADAIQHYIADTRKDIAGDLNFAKRTGSGALQVTSLVFEGGKIYKSGDFFRVTAILDRVLEPQEYEKVQLMFVLSNSLKRFLFTLSNKYSSLRADGPGNKIVFEIPSLPLAEGIYSIDYWMEYLGIYADGVKEITSIEVIGADFYNTGYMPVPRKHGEFLVNHHAYLQS